MTATEVEMRWTHRVSGNTWVRKVSDNPLPEFMGHWLDKVLTIIKPK